MTPRPQALYRFYDATDALLYIGITNHLSRRFGQHEGEKTWFGQVARVTIEHHPDRPAVLAAEKAAIQREKPRHNVHHNERRPAQPTKGTGRWYFETHRTGHPRTVDLWLYPELDCSSMVDDYCDYDGEEQLDEYVRYLGRKHPRWLKDDAVPIYWSVNGPGVCETAPFQDWATAYAADGSGGQVPDGFHEDFLSYFTWPYDPQTGQQLDWYQLPVINDRFPGFAKALAWTPSPLQPTCPLRSVLSSRAGSWTRSRRTA